MVTRSDNNEFLPGKLPGNQYAFQNCLFLNPADYSVYLQQNGSRKPVYVKVKTLVLRLEPLEGITQGEVGASALQKEAMRVSKIDTIRVEHVRVKDENPLTSAECTIDVIFVDNALPREPGKPIPLEQTEISEAITKLFREKFLNKGELFPIAMRDGAIVLKVCIQAIEALKHGNTQNYGIVDDNTIFRFKVN